MKADWDEGFGEIAGVLFKVAKYAATRFNIGGARLKGGGGGSVQWV